MTKETPQRIYVRLDRSDLDHLARLAKTARRHPADEAGLIIAAALRERRGELAGNNRAEVRLVDDD